MQEINTSKPILVTGASGFIASWIVKYLLEGGYTVHSTVRDKNNAQKVQHLLKMDEDAPGYLKLFEADLLNQGAFAEAMQGCELVIHTASPFQTQVKNAQKQLIEPALEGTRNVLQSANEIETVKKVVLTSSVVAVMGDAIEIEDTEDHVFTEDHWNLSSDLKHQPYSYSKTLAEKEAWRMNQDQERWHLVVINPAFVLGPSLSNRVDGTSTTFVKNLVDGTFKSGLPNIYFGIADVRDVAQAHINAGLMPHPSGRHITAAETLPMLGIARIIKSFFGKKYPVPKQQLPAWAMYLVGPFQGFSWKYIRRNLGYQYTFDNSYSQQDLNLQYRPVEETIIDQVKDLEARGLI
ncbi:MAG: NAD-dependent epimerase/dehydratase family protein [Saprospiraceae bacterium]